MAGIAHVIHEDHLKKIHFGPVEFICHSHIVSLDKYWTNMTLAHPMVFRVESPHNLSGISQKLDLFYHPHSHEIELFELDKRKRT